jgi:Tol biopolymer transport system component
MKKKISLTFVLILNMAMGQAKADFVFDTPTKLESSVNSPAADGDTSISTDGLELFFEGRRPDGYGGLGDLYVSIRETTSDPWSEAVILDPPISGPDWDGQPSISSDDLELYFTSDRTGNIDLWVSKRATKDDLWEEPVNLGSTVNSSVDDFGPSISSDGLSLYFGSKRSGGFGKLDLWVTTRATKDAPWDEPVNLGATVNSSLDEAMPDISADGRVLFFSDFMGPPQRDGGYGGQDLWMTTRISTSDPWQEPVNLGPVVNSSAFDFSPNISTDGSTFYFTSDRGGINRFEVVDIYQAQVIPIVDLNADGIVDSADICIIVDYWGTDNSLCDIGPMPWGDGVVDVQDLIVLAEHLFEEFPPIDEPTEEIEAPTQ